MSAAAKAEDFAPAMMHVQSLRIIEKDAFV